MGELTSDPKKHAAEVPGEEEELNAEEEEPIRLDGEDHTDIAEVVGTTDLACGIGETDGDCGLMDESSDEVPPVEPRPESPEGDASGAASDIDQGLF